ncbi:MAG: hypothetical protein QXI33_02125 [Candidatus Pacearchaeota archaeon]
MKVVIFDSGTLITLSMNCVLDIIREIKKKFDGKFLITKEIKSEIVDTPLNIKKYKLGAIRLRTLIEERVLEFPEVLGIKNNEIELLSREILKSTNSLFYADKNPVHIIDAGEASVLALNFLLKKKSSDVLIAMDERTTRILCEKPENLKNLLESKLHTKIKQEGIRQEFFKDINFIRSSELIYVAFKKGIIKSQSKEMLDALLYGAKFKGASISNEEINEIKKLG